MGSNSPYLLVDVRPEVEVEMCSIQNAVNLPLARLKEGREEDAALLQRGGKSQPIFMICRFKDFHDTHLGIMHVVTGEAMTARRG